MARTRFVIEGMDCAACASKIDAAVRAMPGIEDVQVSVMAGTMTVSHAGAASLDGIAGRVTGLGYGIRPASADRHGGHAGSHGGCSHDHHHDHDHDHAHGHGHDHAHGPAHDHAAHRHHPPAEAREAASFHDHDHGPAGQPWWRSRKGVLTIASGLALCAAFAAGRIEPAIGHWAYLAAMLVGLVPIARRAAMAALAGVPFTIETLMTIAAAGAAFIGAGEEAAVVVFLFLVGEMLEGVAAGRARDGIRALKRLVPRTALVEEDGQVRPVPAEDLAVGQVVLVRPGDRVPADGEIVAGEGAIDESAVTGESVPVSRTIGDAVLAGTINGDAALRIRVTATAADNTIARVVRLVEEAQESKAPTERLIDRFSRSYTPAVLALGALVAVLPPVLAGGEWTVWIYRGLAVLLIGCPCALVISTPAAIAASLSAGARRGLLMKGGAVLETIGQVAVVAFDKTGTLTLGRPVVTDIVGIGCEEREVLRLAAALEAGSSHPLALAILSRAAVADIPAAGAARTTAIGGKGLEGEVDGRAVFVGAVHAARERLGANAAPDPGVDGRIEALRADGKTVSLLIVDGALAGILAMRDEPRDDALDGLKALARLGVRAVMLTGDNATTAAAVAGALGIADVRADLLPADKQRIVMALKAAGTRVAKVGDGINDAPALAAADVGIAMGGGTDVALETADAAVLHGRVGDVARMIALSRRTMANIRQNITIALGLKAVFLVTTVIGVTGLWPAILADTGATVLVTANAMRLLRPLGREAA